MSETHPDWRGWHIRLKQELLYAQAEFHGHISWTADKSKAMGFRKKGEAHEFIRSLGKDPADFLISFTPWSQLK